jgi:hypothetical protein
MAEAVERLAHLASARPAAWDTLLPSDPEVKWQVWTREKGPGYWLMRYATRLARLLGANVTNPNALEDGGTFHTEDEARELCRLLHEKTRGRYAVTYAPVVLGRAYPVERVVCKGDRYFDPFRRFDYSATEDVKEQARYALVDLERLAALEAKIERISAGVRAAL